MPLPNQQISNPLSSSIYASSDMSPIVVESSYRYPFLEYGDRSTVVYNLVMQAGRDFDYILPEGTRLNEVSCPGTPYIDNEAYYLTDTEPEDIGGGLIEWSRKFGRIPQTRREPAQIPFEIPGAEPSGTSYILVFNTNYTGGVRPRTIDGVNSSLLFIDNPSFAFGTPQAGDFVTVAYGVSEKLTGAFNATYFFGKKIRTKVKSYSASRIELFPFNEELLKGKSIDLATNGTLPNSLKVSSTFNVQITQIKEQTENRNPKSKPVSGFFEYKYTTEDPTSSPLEEPFSIIDNAGDEVRVLEPDTEPTYSEYIEKVNNGEFLVSDYPTIRRWEGSNIWEIITPKVRAVL